MSKIKNKQISNNTKTVKKDKKPKLFIASVITSILLLLSVTFAWFVNIIELPFFRAETGTIGFVAKGYESNGELVGVLKNTVQRDAETNEIVTTDQKGPLFKISNLAAGDAVSYYLSVEKSGTLDMDYALSFTIDVDETDMKYLGGFWYRVTILNSSADGSDTTLVDFNKAVGKDGNKLPLDYEPIDADYSKVVESYASYNPTNSCSSVCSREDDGSIKEHKCSEYELDAANLSTINRSSKFGTLTKSSPRQIIRVDFGLRSEAIEPEYTDLTIKLYSKIYATQLGAIDNPNGIGKSYYAYDVESLKEIIHNALPGDSVFLSSNINYYGDLIFNKAISLYTNGYSLNVYGNLLYNYATSHKLDVNLVGGGNISVLANDAGIGGDFTIEAPNANVNVSGVNFASAIYVSNNFNVDVTNDAKSDGISFKGLHICYPVNANGVAEPHNLILDSDSKVLVNSGVVFNSITSKNQASNIEITNYGTINSINLASMHLVDEDDASYYDSMSPQILIKNYGTMSSPTSPIVLPAWSVPFLTDFNSGEEHFDYYGNTKIIRYWGASEIIIFDNAQPFKDIHIIDYNKVDAYVEQIGNDISMNGYPVKIRVYYRDKEDETTTIQSLLEEYYKQNYPIDGSLITTALNDIKHIEVVAVEGKYVTQSDLQFFDSCQALSSIDLREAHFANNTMGYRMYHGNSRITNFVLPKDLEYISYHNLANCTSLEEIVVPASVVSIRNDGGDLFGSCKYVYFEGAFPTEYTYADRNKYKAIFCDEAYLKTFREKLGSSKKAYPMAQRDDSGNNFVRKIDNGYELVFTSNDSSSISVGSNIRLNGEKLKITSVGSYCFANFTHEYTIEFDDSIEVLNAGAFYEQKIVGEVNFNKIKEIKGSTFYNCDKITNLVFEETKRIESSAFAACDGITKLDTGSVEYIGTYAFNLCANLEEASFPNCKTIDSNALRECKQLKIVDTGSTEEIKNLAFYACNIIKLVMPEVKTIGVDAFCRNNYLAYVEMYKVEKIETSAFGYCENIYEIYLYNDDFSNVAYTSLPRLNALGNAFVKLNARSSFTSKYNTYGSFIYPVGHKVGTYSKTVGGIEFDLGEYVIYDLENGTSNYGVSVYNGQQNTNHIYGDSFTVGEDVTLNVGGEEKTYNITSVYANAFYRIITDEMTLNFTDDVVTLGSYAFHSDKTYLKKTQFINFGGVERIGYACFESNQYLVRFNSDNKIKYIDQNAFNSNSSLVEIILPEIEEFYFTGNADNNIFVNATSLVKFEIGPNYKGTIARTLIHNSSNVRQIIFRMTDTNQFKYSRYFTDSFTYSDQLRIFVPREVYSFWNSNVVGNFNNSLRELGEMVGEYNYEVKTPYSGTQYVNLGQYCISDYTTSDGISGKAFTSFNVKNEDLDEDFKIPDSYDGVDIIRIGNKCFYNYDFDKYHNVTNEETSENFEIPDTVLVIGIYAFYVSTVNILDFNNVSIIGDYAFYNCDKIKGVLNANNLVTMNSCAFYDCDNIFEFYAENLTYIGNEAFRGAGNLVKVHTPKLSYISWACLYDVPNLISLSFGELTHCGTDLFSSSVKFKEILIYSNNLSKTSDFHAFCNINTLVYAYKDMTSAAESKFYIKNENWKSIVFPMGHKIGNYPFAAPNGYYINIGEYIVTDDGVLSTFNIYRDSNNNTTLNINEDYAVPDIVKVNDKLSIEINSIYKWAYRHINFGEITLTFPETIQSVGYCSFRNNLDLGYGIKKIKYIDFGGLEEVGQDAFSFCRHLVSFNDDNNIKIVGDGAFAYANSLVKVVLPEITTMSYNQGSSATFREAKSLVKIEFGKNLSGTLYNNVVTDAKNLRYVVFGMDNLSNITFYADALKEYQVNPNVKLYGCEDFINKYCTQTGDDIINKQLRNKGTMYGKYEVEVDLPYGDTIKVDIGEYCVGESSTGNLSFNGFNYDTLDYQGIPSIPNNIDGRVIDSIGYAAFHSFIFDDKVVIDDEYQTNFEFTDNIKNIGKFAFAKSNIRVHDFKNVESIGYCAFFKTSNIYDIYLPNVITIAQSAFNQCTNLVVVDMRNAKTIGNYGFYNTKHLRSIKFGAIETIGTDAFKDVAQIYEIYFYNTDISSYTHYAFQDNTYLHLYVYEDQIPAFRAKTSSYANRVIPLGNKVGSYLMSSTNNYEYEVGEYILTENGIISYYNKDHITEDLIFQETVDTVDIDGNIVNRPIYSIYSYAFYHNQLGTSEDPISISFNCINNIGSRAFSNIGTHKKYIDYIDFGSVTTIGNYAFSQCDYLYGFNNDNLIETIGYYAFEGCKSLVEVKLPKIVSFGYYTSGGCSYHDTFTNAVSLKVLDLGEDFVGPWYRRMITNASNLRQLIIRSNDTVKITVGNQWYDTHFDGFDYPNYSVYVKAITKTDFINRFSFDSKVIDFGEFVEDYIIEVETPYAGIREVNLYRYNVELYTFNGVNGVSLNHVNYLHDDKESWKNFRIPNEITLNGVVYPVIKLGTNSFRNIPFDLIDPINKSKENISFPDNLLEIGSSAFEATKVRVSDFNNVIKVNSRAFYNCDNLYVLRSDCIDYIGTDAFNSCDNLMLVNMPTLREVGSTVFRSSNSLMALYTDVQIWDGNYYNSPFWPSTSSLRVMTYATTPGVSLNYSIYGFSGFIGLTNSKNIHNTNRDIETVLPVGKQVFKCYENNGTEIEGYDIELPEYYINKTGDVTIYRCLIEKHTEDYYLPAVLDDRPVTTVSEYAFSNINFGNNEVFLPTSLKTLRNYAFADSTIGGTFNTNEVTTFGQYCFSGTNIEKIILPSLTSNGIDLFAGMKMVEEIIAPTLGAIHANSFQNCNSLKIIRVSKLVNLGGNVNLPKNITVIIEKPSNTVDSSIASRWSNTSYTSTNIDPKLNTFLVPYVDLAKYQATALKDAILKPYGEIYVTPDGLETYVLEDLGDSWNILYLITDKESVIIPNIIEVTKEDSTKVSKVVSGIDELALNTAPSMKSITLPQSYCYYEDLTFTNAISLEEIIVDGSNTYFDSLDGVLYTEGLIELVSFPTKKNVVSFTTNTNTIIIDSYAFANCAFLRDVVIDTSVKVIGAYAFEDTILQTITFNSSTVPYITSSRIFDEYNQDLIIFVPEASLNIYKLNVALQDYRIEAIGTVIE